MTHSGDDRVALITGAGRGIGLAIAKRLARNGSAVCITDLDGELAQAAAAAIEDARSASAATSRARRTAIAGLAPPPTASATCISSSTTRG